MMVPTVHLNGTDKNVLLEDISDAAAALRIAAEKLHEMSPNGRDYYPQGSNAIGKAIAEHTIRIKKVMDIYDELSVLFEAIDIQEG